MSQCMVRFAAAGLSLFAIGIALPAAAQKAGGILQVYTVDSPASMSIHEEQTVFAERPMLGVFNNLITFDPKIRQNSINSIVPDLATEWWWNEDGTELTFKLRQGVKWHDGKPFTAADVKCTWDLLTGTSNDKLRVNPRKPWYRNLKEVATKGDYEVHFLLTQPQPAFVMMLASGFSPVYPCHVRRRCANTRSAPGHSNSSSSSRTRTSRSLATRITGRRTARISTVSSGP
jgi:peptide/nickel transport system substrate-binding protein